MKVAVYAIARNEAKHVSRWMESMKEADGVFVLDTGSCDGTEDLLRNAGANVSVLATNAPFRFDVARNLSLDLVPHEFDWCCCTDLDEVFRPGWRNALELAVRHALLDNPNAAVCEFITAFSDDGKPLARMDYWKFHKRGSARWKEPVHEYLDWTEPRRYVKVDAVLEHHPDDGKSRAQYLDMMERAVREEPTPRMLFYLGREYLYRGNFIGAVATLSQYLMHPGATFGKERAWAYRYVARACRETGNLNAAVRWYVAAAKEDGEQRESLVEYAKMCREIGLLDEAIRAMECAVARTKRPEIFFTEDDSWDGTPERLLESWKKERTTL